MLRLIDNREHEIREHLYVFNDISNDNLLLEI